MILQRILILLLLLAPCLARAQPPATVLVGATFTSSTTAAISWQQPAGVYETCLRREYGAEWPAGICWRNLPAGLMRVDLPGQLTHPAYRPAYGDRYVLSFEGVDVGSAVLGEAAVHTVYLTLVAKQNPPEPHLIYLPALPFAAAAPALLIAAGSAMAPLASSSPDRPRS